MNKYTRWYFEHAPFWTDLPQRIMLCSIYELQGSEYSKHFTISLN